MGFFKTKPYIHVQAGQFKFDFYYKEGKPDKCYLDITIPSKIFSCRIGGNTHAYGYLLAAAQQDKTEQLQGYAITLFIPAMELTQDKGLCGDLQKGIMKWQQRKEKAAETAAKSVSAHQEMADDALMRGSIERGRMNRRERRKAERASRKEMKQMLQEDKESEE